jgi:hypothetical protein
MAKSAHVPIVPVVWADFYRKTRIPGALRVGDTLRVTGHTGETGDGVFSSNSSSAIARASGRDRPTSASARNVLVGDAVTMA